MPNSSSSKSSSYKGSRCPSPSQQVDSGGLMADPAGNLHPLVHTPPPAIRTEARRLPSRSGSTASLLSPFASLTRRLGAKSKNKAAAGSARSTPNPQASRMSTPADFPPSMLMGPAGCPQPSRSTTPAQMSMYSTFPRIHSSSPGSSSPSQTPFLNQLLQSGGAATPTGSGRSCPSPSSSSLSQRLSVAGMPAPMELTEVLDEPVEEEVRTGGAAAAGSDFVCGKGGRWWELTRGPPP